MDQVTTIGQVISRAREVLEPGKYQWAAAGAGSGVTVSRNTAALNRLALVPRVLADVSRIDTRSSFVGVPLSFPVVLAPVAALGIYHPGDALASASAAADHGTSAFCGILTASPWDDVAATAPGRHFFQLYVMGDRDWVATVVDRAESAGFAGICVTVDSPVVGRRDSSLEDGFTWSVPPEGTVNLRELGIDYRYRPGLDWSDFEWLVARTDLPVVIKGVMSPEDAIRAVEAGAAGIVVSNHGGRMVDHGLSTIEALAEIVESVGQRVDVAIDGGFTRGAEVCKALALGARAVGIGRLQCWGLAIGGADGVSRVLSILRAEIEATMANIGCPTLADIGPGHVRWSFPAPPV